MTSSWLPALAAAPMNSFADWPDETLEKGKPGVYAIFCDERLLYAGLSYRSREDTTNPQAQGVWGRLATHARGTAPGQLADGVRDHYVLPRLTTDGVPAGFDMKAAIRTFIRTRCTYRAITTPTGEDARAAEAAARIGGLGTYGPPLFNPLSQGMSSDSREDEPPRREATETVRSAGRHPAAPRRRVIQPGEPTTYPNDRDDDPWDNDAMGWLLEQPGVADHFTRGVLFECARRQPQRLADDSRRVDLASELCRRHGVEQVLIFDVAKGKDIWRLRRTDPDAPAYPDYEAMKR